MVLNNKTMDESAVLPPVRLDLASFVPDAVGALENPQLDLPRIAKDPHLTNQIDWAIQRVPTHHQLFQHDARSIDFIKPASVHLVLTSPGQTHLNL